MNRFLLLTIVGIVFISGCGDTRKPRLNGTGSTQVSSLFDSWSDKERGYKGATLSYVDVGSGTGTDLFLAQDYDFFCSEIPLDEKQKEQAKKNGINLVGFPLAFSAVVPVYNLEKVTKPIVFSGSVLADIFLGKITKWNDEELKKLNPGVELPDQSIRVVVRSDPSGTSYVFTKFLAQESELWKKEKKGAQSVPLWSKSSNEKLQPVVSKFQEIPGSKGVIKAIRKENGTLGFLALGLAQKEKLQIGQLSVKDKVIEANAATIQTAIKESLKEIPQDLLKFEFPEKLSEGAFPIVGTNWIYFSADPKSPKYKDMMDFAKWSIHDGQDTLENLSFYKIPSNLVGKLEKTLGNTEAAVKK